MKKILAIVAAFAVVAFNGFMLLEGSVSNAASVVDYWNVTLDVNAELAMDCGTTSTPTALLPAISGMTGGTANGTRTCNVETNNDGGWTLAVHAQAAPALVSGGNSIADYATTTPETWVLPATNLAYFGFYASSTNPESGYGVDKYRGFNGATDITVSNNTNETGPTGVDTTFGFRAQIGSTKNQATGAYAATITATASTL